MDTRTLDSKLRDRGYGKLRERIEHQFTNLLGEIGNDGRWAETELIDPKSQSSESVEHVLNAAKRAIIAALRPEAEQDEVNDFLSKVDNLQQEIDDLRDDIDGI